MLFLLFCKLDQITALGMVDWTSSLFFLRAQFCACEITDTDQRCAHYHIKYVYVEFSYFNAKEDFVCHLLIVIDRSLLYIRQGFVGFSHMRKVL